MIKKVILFLWLNGEDADDPKEGRANNRKAFGFLKSYEEGWTLGHWTVMGVRYTFFF